MSANSKDPKPVHNRSPIKKKLESVLGKLILDNIGKRQLKPKAELESRNVKKEKLTHDSTVSKWLTKHRATLKNSDYLISREQRQRIEQAQTIFSKIDQLNKGWIDLAQILPEINQHTPLTSA